MHVNTLQNSSQTYTVNELQQLINSGKLDGTKITDVSVFNKSADQGACKDGNDDGKIGFFEGLKETVSGAVKGVVNGIKGCFTDENGKFSLGKTLKTAATIGACFIPGVGPVIAGGLCAYGAVKGVAGVANGISAAANATTDAEKRAAFQSIGANGVATAASVAGLKGSVSAIAKNAGAISSTGAPSITAGTGKGVLGTAKNVATNIVKGSTNYYKGAWSSATGTTFQKLGQVAKGTLTDTAGNMVGAAKATGSAVKNSKVGQTVSKAANKVANSKVGQAAGKVGGAAKNVGSKIANSGLGKKVGAAAGKIGGAAKKVGGKITGSKVGQAASGFVSDVSTSAAGGYKGMGATPLYGGLTVASIQAGNVATDTENGIYTANQAFATLNTQTGYEYDLQDYNVISEDALNQKYAAIMQNARAI